MDDAPGTPSTASVEERLARLEKAATPRQSALDRLLRFLPVIAIGNLFLAAPAMLVSIAVAYFTFVQAEATEKMQVASVWPRVSYNNANGGSGADGYITLALVNKGVGPAVLHGLRVEYAGRAYRDMRSLLEACCGEVAKGHSMTVATMRGEVLRPGEEAIFARLEAKGTQAALYDRFNRERLKLKISTCYCSVFDECWTDTDNGAGPRAVAQCPADWVQYGDLAPGGRPS